jgi:SAM-dependent methyltransferase
MAASLRARVRHLKDTVRRELAGAASRQLARRYFTSQELDRARINGRTLEIGDAAFRLSLGPRGPKFECTRVPEDDWLVSHLATIEEQRRTWEVIAFVKVRRLSTADQVIERARSGELYDESYFTRRGGGGPYVGYPASIMVEDGRWWEEVAAEVSATVWPGRALDVGCATGLLVKALEDRGIEADGIDVSSWAVAHAVSKRVVQGSATDLPWPDRSFDLVISQDFMEHVHPDDLPTVLAEQVRVARPGATVLHLIPFYPFDPPIQVDAHLCEATQEWWERLFEGVEGLEIARRPNDNAGGRLASYFELRRI